MKRALLVLAFVFCACSSGGPGNPGLGGGGTGGGSLARLCQSVCGWYARCGRAESGCSAECSADTARYEGKWSATFVNHVSTCFETLACTQNDDSCVANFAAVDPAYPNIPEVQACLTKRTDCSSGTSMTSWSDDYCLSIAALTASARAEANACLSKACTEVSTCLRAAGSFGY